jgi:hypothetical protein
MGFFEKKLDKYEKLISTYPNIFEIMPSPTVIIGCGGTGARVLVSLYKKMYNFFDGSIPGFYQFLYFDCDEDAIKRISGNTPLGIDIVKLVMTEEQLKKVLLQLFNKKGIEELEESVQNAFSAFLSHQPGAGIDRIIGSAFIRNNIKIVKRKISEAVISIRDDKDVKNSDYQHGIHFYIISSICGGTGAGIFLNVAEIIKDLYQNQKEILTPDVEWYRYGIIVGPEPFLEELGGTIQNEYVFDLLKGNAYGSLKELNYLLVKKPDFGDLLFQHVYFLNPQEKLENVAEKISDFIFFMQCSPIGSKYRADWVNDVRTYFPEIKDQEKTSLLGDFEVATAIIPINHLLEFAYLRVCRRVWNEIGIEWKGVKDHLQKAGIDITKENIREGLKNGIIGKLREKVKEDYSRNKSSFHDGFETELEKIKKNWIPDEDEFKKSVNFEKLWKEVEKELNEGLIKNGIRGFLDKIKELIDEDKLLSLLDKDKGKISPIVKNVESKFNEMKDKMNFLLILLLETKADLIEKIKDLREKIKKEKNELDEKVNNFEDEWKEERNKAAERVIKLKYGGYQSKWMKFLYYLLHYYYMLIEFFLMRQKVEKIIKKIEKGIKERKGLFKEIAGKILFLEFIRETGHKIEEIINEKIDNEFFTFQKVDTDFRQRYLEVVKSVRDKQELMPPSRFFFPILQQQAGGKDDPLKEKIFKKFFYEQMVRNKNIDKIKELVQKYKNKKVNEINQREIEDEVKQLEINLDYNKVLKEIFEVEIAEDSLCKNYLKDEFEKRIKPTAVRGRTQYIYLIAPKLCEKDEDNPKFYENILKVSISYFPSNTPVCLTLLKVVNFISIDEYAELLRKLKESYKKIERKRYVYTFPSLITEMKELVEDE